MGKIQELVQKWSQLCMAAMSNGRPLKTTSHLVSLLKQDKIYKGLGKEYFMNGCNMIFLSTKGGKAPFRAWERKITESRGPKAIPSCSEWKEQKAGGLD